MKSFCYIKNYIYLNRNLFIDSVKSLRNKDLTEYDNQPIDQTYNSLVDYYTKNFVGLFTNSDGNCLFHAVSLNLFGNELNSLKIKLVTAFICFEYEMFIKTFLNEYNYQFDFEALILKTVKDGVWGSEIHFILLSLLLHRPIYCYTPFSSCVSNPLLLSSAPVVLFLQNSHFVAGVRRNFTGQVSMPTSNQMRFYRNIWPEPIYYN